jgi:hypothetical protein
MDNFKPAAELNLTNIERDALIDVLGRMERGEIVSEHNLPPECAVRFKDTPKISMPRFFTKTECGTIGCLAGWANLISDGKAFPEINLVKERVSGRADNDYQEALDFTRTPEFYAMKERLSKETKRLFVMAGGGYHDDLSDLSHITLTNRLRNYLTTGKVNGK